MSSLAPTECVGTALDDDDDEHNDDELDEHMEKDQQKKEEYIHTTHIFVKSHCSFCCIFFRIYTVYICIYLFSFRRRQAEVSQLAYPARKPAAAASFELLVNLTQKTARNGF